MYKAFTNIWQIRVHKWGTILCFYEEYVEKSFKSPYGVARCHNTLSAYCDDLQQTPEGKWGWEKNPIACSCQ